MSERLEQLIQYSRKPTLTQQEQGKVKEWLERDPSLKRVWDQERELSKMLGSLSQVPLSEDFTARVLQQTIERKTVQPVEKVSGFSLWLRGLYANRWVQMAATFCLIAFLGYGGYFQYNQMRIQRVADSLSTVVETATEISAINESDLEAIKFMGDLNESSSVDNELWLAMVSY